MGVETVPLGSCLRLIPVVAAGCTLMASAALAFPATDAENPSVFANPPAPTESDLRHQLQLQSGFGAAASGGGWTFIPRIMGEEFYTDNVLQSPTDRRWDLVTLVTPGITILGDLPNAQVRLTYAPQFRLDATTPQENSVTQQLIGSGQFTIVPDAFYVDARAFAGTAPAFGGFNAFGTGLTPQFGQPGQGLGLQGLSKQNRTQNNSFSLTPYYLHRFGDTGTVKVGYELNATSISPNDSIVPLPFPVGASSQHSLTNQVVAQFETGEQFAPFRDLVIGSAAASSGTGVSHNSREYIFKNQLGYAINRQLNVYGEVGYENLQFGGVPATKIDDAIWGVGFQWMPNEDSSITLGYGHDRGVTGVQFAGYYSITPRTRISARYTTGVQTDLQQLQGQLDLAALDQNGNAVDAQTGAPLFPGLNGLGSQSGLFRAKNLSATASTTLDRDQINVTALWTQNTTIAAATATANTVFNPATPSVGSTSEGVTGLVTWIHQINESLSLNATGSYGLNSVNGGAAAGSTGRLTSLGAAVGMQYLLSQTLTTFVRYTYFARLSDRPDQSIYQNLFLVGINKQF